MKLIYFAILIFISCLNRKANKENVRNEFSIINKNVDTLKSLENFDSCIKKYCRPVYDRLDKGLSQDYINDKFSKLGIASEGLKELYQWRNGFKDRAAHYILKLDFCSTGKMISLDDAIELYNSYVQKDIWEKKYFPIFTTNGGEYLLYDTNKQGKTYGMIFFYAPGLMIADPTPVYENLNSFLETIIACYESGIYKFDESTETLEIDDEQEFKLSYQKNPSCSYWKE